MSSAEIKAFNFSFNFCIQFLHSVDKASKNRIQFFYIQLISLDFSFSFCGPGHFLVFTWSKIHSVLRVSLCLGTWFARLVGDSEGSISQKFIQFCSLPSETWQKFIQFSWCLLVFTWSCPGVQAKKMGEAATSTHRFPLTNYHV